MGKIKKWTSTKSRAENTRNLGMPKIRKGEARSAVIILSQCHRRCGINSKEVRNKLKPTGGKAGGMSGETLTI